MKRRGFFGSLLGGIAAVAASQIKKPAAVVPGNDHAAHLKLHQMALDNASLAAHPPVVADDGAFLLDGHPGRVTSYRASLAMSKYQMKPDDLDFYIRLAEQVKRERDGIILRMIGAPQA